MIGRLKPGVTFDAGVADLKRVAKQLEHHPDNKGWDVVAQRSETWVASDDLRRMLWVMLWAVLLLLVIASVNVANHCSCGRPLAHAIAQVRDGAWRHARRSFCGRASPNRRR